MTGTPALPAGWPYHLHPGDVYGLTPEERERAAVRWLSHVAEDWHWRMAQQAASEAEAVRLLASVGRAGSYESSSPDGFRLGTYDSGVYVRYPSGRWGRLTWLDLARRARMGRGAAPGQGVLL